MSIASSLKPIEIRHHLRGDIEKFDKIDRFFLGLKKITKIDDGKHYRFCYICSKIQKYLDKKHLRPEHYEAKIEVKLREFVQLIHEHISDIDPTEANFYEFVLEGWGTLSQNVRFNTDPYIRFIKIVIEEHAKFRATDKGELTAASLIDFCSHLDEYVDKALKPVVPDWYHLFLGPQHPAAQLLFATRGKKEDKISPDTVKADIRRRMLESVVELFGEELTTADKTELKQALDRLAVQLKANPAYAKELAPLLQKNDSSKAGNPEFALIGMRLFNAREALGKRESYNFTNLMTLGEPAMSYSHPFIQDVRFYRNMKATLAKMEQDIDGLRQQVAHQMEVEGREIAQKLSYLTPFMKDIERELHELKKKITEYPPTLEEEATACARHVIKMEGELALLKAKMAITTASEAALKTQQAAFSSLSQKAHDRRLTLARIETREHQLHDYQELQNRAQRTAAKPDQLEKLFSAYQRGVQMEIERLQKKTYQLSVFQLKVLFPSI